MSDYLDPDNKELLADFFQEATQQVDILEQNILTLEHDAANREAVDEIFRAAHTLKGGASTVGMKELAHITHLVEDVLDEIRSGRQKVSSELVDCILSSIDVIKDILDAKSQGNPYKGNTQKLEKALSGFLQAGGEKATARKAGGKASIISRPVSAAKARAESDELSEYELLEITQAGSGSGFQITVDFNEDNPMNTVGGIQVYAALKDIGKIIKTVPDFESLYSDTFYPKITYYISSEQTVDVMEKQCTIPDVTLGISVVPLSVGRAQKGAQKPAGKTAEETTDEPEEAGEKINSEERTRKTIGSVVRVDSRRIDQLLNLVSEIVIVKASFNQLAGGIFSLYNEFGTSAEAFRERIKDLFDSIPEYLEEMKAGKPVKTIRKEMQTRFGDLLNFYGKLENGLKENNVRVRSATQNLGRITGDLQEGVMQIRMVPISHIFSRFPRLVRDLSKSLKKNIELNLLGEETELDKSVIEDLLDPLSHCVRNSIDHGIEDPEERVRLGKSPEGNVVLKASNEGNLIMIEISDDGRGIDIDKVRNKAVLNGMIHENKNLSDIEAFNIIFEPGFSTAKKVTDVSGRGVGLDVVKKQVEKLNGTVSVWSEKNSGTQFTIKLPLTLAIIQGLLVRVGGNVFAIPITSVLETLRLRKDEMKQIDNYEVFDLREDVISLVRLHRIFGIPESESGDQKSDTLFIVVVGSRGSRIGLLVDSLIGEEDIVIKPLKDKFTKSPGIAGATILGDGTVSLIIDVGQLLELGMRIGVEERKKRDFSVLK
ncbi:MAG: chemotaxis protein CheA [Spirochaetaceae bacterium]|nr:MAG: chemotaxis protein CheA [Spirochaetaceae bacterium]